MWYTLYGPAACLHVRILGVFFIHDHFKQVTISSQ